MRIAKLRTRGIATAEHPICNRKDQLPEPRQLILQRVFMVQGSHPHKYMDEMVRVDVTRACCHVTADHFVMIRASADD